MPPRFAVRCKAATSFLQRAARKTDDTQGSGRTPPLPGVPHPFRPPEAVGRSVQKTAGSRATIRAISANSRQPGVSSMPVTSNARTGFIITIRIALRKRLWIDLQTGYPPEASGLLQCLQHVLDDVFRRA